MTQVTRIVAAAAAAVVAAFATVAAAQNWQAQPTYGSVRLAAGFTPDPYTVNLMSGGSINARQTLGGSCVGYVANAPDFDLYWTAGSLPLVISVNSQVDTTLVIHAPDGRWYCEDDGGFEGFNPGIRFDSSQSGLYDIYVGTYSGPTNHQATLSISELTSY